MLSFGSSYINNNQIVYAETIEIENEIDDNIDKILDDIETEEIDDYLNYDVSIDYFSVDSFKDFVLKILSGELFSDYGSLYEYFIANFKGLFKDTFLYVLSILVIVVLYSIFMSLCADRYSDFKKVIKFIFSLVIVISLSRLLATLKDELMSLIDSIFNFSNGLFPILLTLMLSSGASGSFSVYSSLSAFLLNSGLYVFKFVLFPLGVSIAVLSLFEILLDDSKFSKLSNLFKYIFKLILSIMFTIFGIFSTINIISSGMQDGLSLKVTKYAIKNYIPILGGYISEGFDFVKSCSVLVKNAFGLSGIIVLFFTILKPLIVYFCYVISFKFLSVLTSFVGCEKYANGFEKFSKGLSFLIAVLIGLCLIMLVFIFLMIV